MKNTRNYSKSSIASNTKSISVKPRLSKIDRSNVTIPEEAKETLVGLLLGDAHIQKRSSTSNSRLIYVQSEVHKDYFNYVYNIFKSFCVEGSTPKIKTLLQSGNYYTSLTFATMQLPCFNLFKDVFYNLNKKNSTD